MKDFYRQCELKRGNTFTVSWVPEHGARVGYSFLLKGDDDGRWLVMSVGDARILREDLGKSDVFDSIKPKKS